MIVGCGIDIEEKDRFDKHLQDIEKSAFIRFVFTEREIQNYKPDYRFYIPVSFCCKEAIFKAIGCSWTNSNVLWQDIELLFDNANHNNYSIVLSGQVKAIMKRLHKPKLISAYDVTNESVTFYVILANE